MERLLLLLASFNLRLFLASSSAAQGYQLGSILDFQSFPVSCEFIFVNFDTTDLKLDVWRGLAVLLPHDSKNTAIQQLTTDQSNHVFAIIRQSKNMSIIWSHSPILASSTLLLIRPATFISQQSDNNSFIRDILNHRADMIKSSVHSHKIAVGPTAEFQDFTSTLSHKTDFHGAEINAVAKKDSKALKPEGTYDVGRFTVQEQKDIGAAIFWNLRDMLNFTSKVFLGSPIVVTDDGQVSGRTYDLLRNGQANLFIEQTTLIPEEAAVFSFLQPIGYGDGIMAFFAQPSFITLREVLVDTFSISMWIATGLLGITIAGLVMALGWMTLDTVPPEDATFAKDGLWWIIALFAQRGWPLEPQGGPMRIAFCSALFLSYIIYSAYSAVICSVLSVEQVAVKSVEDLIQFKYTFYAFNGSKTTQSFLEDYFIPKHSLSQKLRVFTVENEARLLRTPRRAILSYDDKFHGSALESNVSTAFICQRVWYFPVQGKKEPTLRSMLVLKGSALREIFDHKVQLMRERGFIQRYLLQNNNAIKPRCVKSGVAEIHQFLIRDIWIAFAIVCAGQVSALVALGLEIFVVKMRKAISARRPKPCFVM